MRAEPFLIVDDQSISLGQALNYLQSSGKLGSFVGDILRQHIIEQELQIADGLDISSTTIEQVVIDFRLQRQLSDPQVFQEWLKSNGTDYETFHRQVSYSFKLSRLKSRIAQPNLIEYFRERKPFLDRVVLSRLIVDNPKLAQDLRSKLDQGTRFEPLVKEYSITDDRIVNGMMGPVSRGTLPDQLRTAVDSANPGDLVGPLEVDKHWGVFRVEQFLPANLEDSQLKQALQDELFERWIAQKIQKLTVKLQLS